MRERERERERVCIFTRLLYESVFLAISYLLSVVLKICERERSKHIFFILSTTRRRTRNRSLHVIIIMFATSASATTFVASSSHRFRSRRSCVRVLLRAAKPSSFDPSDPLTWNQPENKDGFALANDIVANVEDVQMLTDADLAKIVGMEGASVPQMVGDRISEGGKSLDLYDEEEEEEGNRAATTTAEGINEGMKLYKQKEYREAEAAFRAALTLPGTGPVRFRKAKVAPAGPSAGFEARESSQAEILAAHYNRACCFAQMGEVDDGLECLKLSIENGFDDFKYLRTDKDVALLRDDKRFERLMDKYEPKGVVGALNELMKGNGGMNNPGGVVGMFMDKMKK